MQSARHRRVANCIRRAHKNQRRKTTRTQKLHRIFRKKKKNCEAAFYTHNQPRSLSNSSQPVQLTRAFLCRTRKQESKMRIPAYERCTFGGICVIKRHPAYVRAAVRRRRRLQGGAFHPPSPPHAARAPTAAERRRALE